MAKDQTGCRELQKQLEEDLESFHVIFE